MTVANYPIALEMIKERFGDEDRIVAAHINALLSVSSPSSYKGAKYIADLWKKFDELNRNIKCLEALKIDGKQYGRVLTPIILSRLPDDLRLEWSRNAAGQQFNLEHSKLEHPPAQRYTLKRI